MKPEKAHRTFPLVLEFSVSGNPVIELGDKSRSQRRIYGALNYR